MLLKGKNKMKKVIRCIIHNRKIIFEKIALFVLAVIAFELAHKSGTAQRGYEAIGGEIFVPLLVIFAPQIWEIIKAPFVKE